MNFIDPWSERSLTLDLSTPQEALTCSIITLVPMANLSADHHRSNAFKLWAFTHLKKAGRHQSYVFFASRPKSLSFLYLMCCYHWLSLRPVPSPIAVWNVYPRLYHFAAWFHYWAHSITLRSEIQPFIAVSLYYTSAFKATTELIVLGLPHFPPRTAFPTHQVELRAMTPPLRSH